MKKRNWTLLNAASLQKKYPSKYIRPKARELMGMLVTGNMAQLILKVTRTTPRKSIGIEFIWVEVLGFKSGVYYGSLINQSGIVKELEKGRKLMFIPEQVLLCKEHKEEEIMIPLQVKKGA